MSEQAETISVVIASDSNGRVKKACYSPKGNLMISPCPVCLGNGQVEMRDLEKELAAVFITLNKVDQDEVLFYAGYLKTRRGRDE